MATLKTYVTNLPQVTDPAQFEIPGFDRNTNAGGKALMSDLKGDTGPAPNITIEMTAVPYGTAPSVDKGGTDTAPTFNIKFPLAADGRTPMFQNNGTYIQYRYTDTEQWQNLVDLDTLRLHFTDLTTEQADSLKLHFSDLTDEEIALLQKPATDAAATVNTVISDAETATGNANAATDAANEAADNANTAAGAANTAAENVQDGKTPIMGGATAARLPATEQPTAQFVQTGTDVDGNPTYRLDLGIPEGERGIQGFTPEFRGNEFSTGDPNSVAVVVVSIIGYNSATGAPVYQFSGTIPKGAPGDGSGNVEVDATGLEAGRQYVFVPNQNGSPIGTFQEYTGGQPDWSQQDDAAGDYIKNKPALSQVATSGSYNDLTDKPLSGSPIVSDVTDMLSTNSPNARFSARMTGHPDGKKVVEVFGEDTSGTSNDLVITASLGFGADNDKPKNVREYGSADAAAPTDYKVIVTPETADGTNCTFRIPMGCPEFYFKYFVGIAGSYNKRSYYVDSDGVYNNFSADDTPISNFCASGNAQSTVTINGRSIMKSAVREIVFGEDYRATTNIPNYFCYYFSGLSSIDLSVFTNVNTIGDSFLSYCSALQRIDLSAFTNTNTIGNRFLADCISLIQIDLSAFAGLTSLGTYFLYGCDSLINLDVSMLTGLTSIPDYFCSSLSGASNINLMDMSDISTIGNRFCYSNSSLLSLDLSTLSNSVTIGTYFLYSNSKLSDLQIGNVDWSGIAIGANAMYASYNTAARNIHADSAYIAEAFKTKVPNTSNWTVVINE